MTMEMEKNEYGLAGSKQSNLYAGKYHYGEKKSISRSRSNGSHKNTGRENKRQSKSNESKDSL